MVPSQGVYIARDIGVLSPLWVLKSILYPVLAGNPWKFEHSTPPWLDRVQVHASQPAICRCSALDAPGPFLSLLNFIYVAYKNKQESM